MEKHKIDHNLPMSELVTLLSDKNRGLSADFEFAARVTRNDKAAVNYFIREFSLPILNYIEACVLHLKHDGCADAEIQGEYYMFIAAPFNPDRDNVPEWYKVASYKGVNGAKLYTYINRITVNHFIKQRRKYGRYKKNSLQLLEFVDYETLLMYDYSGEDDAAERTDSQRLVRKAYKSLSETDKAVLDCLCVRKMHWSEAFGTLRKYLDPAGPDNQWKGWSFEEKQAAIDAEWQPKQKQDAMSGLKKRAVVHLAKRYVRLMEDMYE